MPDSLVRLALVAGTVLGGVATLLGLATAVCIGRERLVRTAGALGGRLRSVAPYVLGLVLVLAVNKGLQPYTVRLSWAIDQNITGWLASVEGEFVANLQATLPHEAVLYFVGIYVVGYAFLLIFPLLAYLALPDTRHLKRLLVAYAFNYGVGVFFYTLFIAFGPRNIYESVDQPMFELFPDLMLLTAAVNTSSNVFPSLHTSLAVTVFCFALLTAREYPIWAVVATVIAWSVAVSTMALGIHWLIDVLAGIVLAAAAVPFAYAVVWALENRAETRAKWRSIVSRFRRGSPG